jgi:hypothetical protein
MKAPCEMEMVRLAMSREMEIPSANLAGPRSKISYLESRSAWKRFVSLTEGWVRVKGSILGDQIELECDNSEHPPVPSQVRESALRP